MVVFTFAPSVGTLIVLGCLLASSFQAPVKQDAAPSAKVAGEIFAARCVTCHVTPDPTYATDLAWIEQVRETA